MVAEELEPRVLFSADLITITPHDTDEATDFESDHRAPILQHRDTNGDDAASNAEQAGWTGFAAPAELESELAHSRTIGSQSTDAHKTGTGSDHKQTELIFVDYRTPDAEFLLDDIRQNSDEQINFEIVLLNADDNGIELIDTTVQQFESIAAVHIISHGSDGNVYLGAQVLNSTTLAQYSESFASWEATLTNDADILIYGCDVAATDHGQAFVSSLAEVTGADVAASDDLTGHKDLNADWHFEFTVGEIETESAVLSGIQHNWANTLATITVTNFNDVVNGDTTDLNSLLANDGGDGISLREAIDVANDTTAKDTIILASGSHMLDALTGINNLQITTDIEITGSDDGSTIIDASNLNDRAFHVIGATLTLDQLTVSGGSGSNEGGAILVDGLTSTLKASDVTFSGNSSTNTAGAISNNEGTTTLDRVTLTGNSADNDGGAISSRAGTVNISNSTISGNTALDDAGGIELFDGAIVNVDHTTITANTAGEEGGAVSSPLNSTTSTLNVTNSIIAGNMAPTAPEISSNVTTISGGNNIIGNDVGDAANVSGLDPTDLIDQTNLSLAPLADNGGFVPTHELLAGSAGVDSGISFIGQDARGFIRDDGVADIGAFERSATPPIAVNSHSITAPSTSTDEENTVQLFMGANVITIDDGIPGDNPIQVSLSVANGVLNLAALTGIVFVEGADNSNSMVIEGLESDLNAALDGLVYSPDLNFTGADTLSIITEAAASLEGYYTFDGGNADDQSAGTADDGLFLGNATTVIDGTRGEVLSLDGDSDTVRILGLFGNPANVTLAAWIDTSNPNRQDIISLGDNLALRVQSDGEFVVFYHGAGGFQNLFTGIDVRGEWTHVAVTFDDTNDQLVAYVNGDVVSIMPVTESILYSNGSNTFIGHHGNGDSTWDFDGLIDDARVYTRALSMAEVKALATTQTTAMHDVAITVTPDSNELFVNAPASAYSFTEQGSLSLHGTGFNVSDSNNQNGALTATLSVTQGRIFIDPGNSGIQIFTSARNTSAGNDTDTIQIRGTIAQFNALLVGSSTGTIEYFNDQTSSSDVPAASSRINLTVDASGDRVTVSQNINITSVNDNPQFNGPELVTNGTFNNGDLVGWTTVGQVVPLNGGARFGGGNAVSPNAIEQTISTTAGETYTLTFDYRDQRPVAARQNQQLEVTVDGISNLLTVDRIVSDTNDQVYVPYTFTFTADSATSTIRFTDTSDFPNAVSSNTQNIDGEIDNISVRQVGGLLGTTTFIENGSAVTLDNDVTLFDAEINANLDNYNGTTLTLQRYPVSNSDDVFSATGNLVLNAGTLELSSSTIGNYSNTAGVLTITFNASASEAQINEVLQSIAYANTSQTPPPSVQIEWTFDDNNDGSQGTGGALTATGTTIVNITPINDAPIVTAPTSAYSFTEQGSLFIQGTGFSVSDIGNQSGMVQATFAVTEGRLLIDVGNSGVLVSSDDFTVSAGNSTDTVGLSGTLAQLNALLDGSSTGTIEFLHDQTSFSDVPSASAELSLTVNDLGNTGVDPGLSGDANSEEGLASQIINIISVNDAPTFIRSELVTNGTFSTGDLTGWTAIGQTSIVGNTLRFGESQVVGPHSIEQTINTIVGETYKLTFNYRDIDDGRNQQLEVTVDGLSNLLTTDPVVSDTQDDTFVQYTFTFTADSANSTIRFTDTSDDPGAFSTDTRNVDALLDNISVRQTDGILGTTTFLENGAAVTLDNDATLFDAEINALLDNYDGTGLTLQRNGAANSDDVFSTTGNLVLNAGTLELSNVAIGNYTNSAGVLAITFNAAATDAQINEVLQSVAYANTSENPPASVQIDWTFDDNNDGSQGTGGALTATGNTVVNITAINDAPTLATIEAMPAFYIEGGSPIGITGNLALDDVDDINIESATVSISNNFAAGEDELLFTDQLGITGSYDPNTGILTLSGTATVADYQTALRTVAYNNTSGNPSTLTRTASFEINDGDLASNTLSRDIDFTAVNDAPVLSAIEPAPAFFIENDPALIITGTTAVSDVDDTNIESATVSITGNFSSAEDELVFIDQLGITGNYNSTSGTLTLSGTASLADYQTAIQSIAYQNTSDDPSDLTRTVSFEVFDGDNSSNSVTRDIDFTAVNDAPTLATIEALPAFYIEGGSPVGITGNLTLDDVDDINIESAAVSISNNFATGEDELLFTDQLGITGNYDPITGILTLSGTATVADYQTALRTVAYNNTSDDPSTLTRTVSYEINDGDLASNTLSRDIDFTAVNDAPVLSAIEPAPAFYTENDPAIVVTGTTAVADADDTNIESATIAITGNFSTAQDELVFVDQLGITGNYNSTNGTLTLSGSASLANYQTAIQSIAYQNTSDDPSSLTRTVSFEVFDGDNSSNTVTRDIDFTVVNDAPTLATIEAMPAFYTEDGPPVGITGNLALGDVDDINIESATVTISNNFASGEDELLFADQLGITGSYNPGTGVLNLSGSASVADYQAALQTIAYNNTSNDPSTLTRTVSFEINDGDLPSNTLSRDIDFTSVNDAPVLSAIELAPAFYTENDLPVIITGTTAVADVDDTNIESATITITGNYAAGEDELVFVDQLGITGNYNSANGTLNLSGSATVADYQNAIRSVTYQNTSDNPSDLTRTISFEINDGDLPGNTLSRDIEFTAVNDAPVLSATELTPVSYTENDAPAIITGTSAVADVDDINIESAIIAITGNFSTGEDELVFIDQLGITGNYNSTSGILILSGSATLADYQTAIRSIAYENSSDDPSSLTRTVSFEVSDGDNSSNIVTRDIDFTTVNDAPTLATIEAAPAFYTEGGLPVGITGNLALDDVDDINIESAAVSISNNFATGEDELLFTDQLGITGNYDPITGILTLSGTATVADYQTALRTVAYNNTSDNPSTLTRTVSFDINDGDLPGNVLSRDISFSAVNDAPVLSTIETASVSYTENDPAAIITATTAVADVDDTDIESATIAISNNFATGEDVLLFTNQSGITGNYNPVTGTLTLNGTASLADYQTAIQSIAYQNTSDDPSDLTRTVSIEIFDGDDISNTVTRDIEFTAINDAPTLATIEALPAFYIEGGQPVGITGNLALDDVDDINIESATVVISNNFAFGEDELLFTDQFGITGTYNPTIGTLTLTGTASVADYQTALRTVTYNNTSSDPSTQTRTVSFEINDGDLPGNVLSRDINFAAVNDAPVLSAIELAAVSYTENDPAVIITATTAVADVDDLNIESATIAITGNFSAAEDELVFIDQLGITGNYDSTSGSLVLSGSATLADYQLAIQSIAYQNTSEDPSDLTRTVSFEVFDGDFSSNTVTRDIDFTAVNDAPALATIEALPAFYTEGASPVGITGNLTLSDVDDINIESATVAISNNFASGEDELLFTDQLGITGSYNPGTGILALSGTASVADYQTALRTVTYNNTSDDPSTLTRTVSFEINDGDLPSNVLSRDIDFTAVNDAPVLFATELAPASYTENDLPVVITGTTAVSDVDDTNIESATIAITGNVSAVEDELVFVDQLGITGNYDSTNGTLTLSGSATLADYQTALQSIAYQNTSEDPSDLTRTVSFEVSDGDNSSNIVTRDIDFTAVNDAPTLATIEVAPAFYTEGGMPVGITGNLSLGDVDDANIESATVSISNNFASGEDELLFTDQLGITGSYDPGTGILTLSGTASVTDYQTALRAITYNNTSDDPSVLTRTVSFEINDGDLPGNTLSRDIDFTAVNDAPVLSAIELTPASYTENDPPAIITGNTVVADLDDTNIESATIAITGNYTAGQDELVFTDQLGITGNYDSTSGTLTLSGSATLADYQTAIQSIAYQNTSDDPSDLTRTVSFEVFDGDNSSNTVTRDISFSAVNDAPTLAAIEAIPASYTEGGLPVAITGNLALDDVDDINIESATITIVNNLAPGEDQLQFTDQLGISGSYDPTIGVLTLTGSASVTDYQTALRTISYNNTSSNPSDLTRTVSFEINDGDVSSNLLSRNIIFTAVNDAPVLANIESAPASYTENAAPISITNTTAVSDVDDTNIESAVVSISGNFSSGEDNLIFTDQSGITGSYDSITGTLTLSGSAPLAAYQSAIRSISYENASDDPSDLTRTVSFEIFDGDNTSNVITRDIDFTAINDAPALATIEALPASYTENGSPVIITGNLSLSDVDDTNIESASIFIDANFASGEDILNFTDQAGISGTYNNATGVLSLIGTASVADYQTAIRSVTYENISENPLTLDRTVSITINDGDVDSNPISRNIEITAINDAPVVSGAAPLPLTYTENDAPSVLLGSFAISDVDDTLIDSATVFISNNFTIGEDQLTFSDQSGITGFFDNTTGMLLLTGPATVADYETAIQSIAYQNTSDNPSTLTRTVSFTVNDGTADSNTIFQDVLFNAVNDAPEIADLSPAIVDFQENSIAVPIFDTLALSDLDDVNLESAQVIVAGNFVPGEDNLVFTAQNGITGNYDPQTGIIVLSGSASITDYESALRSVGYVNTSDNPSPLTRTIEYRVNDGDTDSNVASRDINVAIFNDNPVFISLETTVLIYTENQAPLHVTETVGITDVDNTTLSSALISITGNYLSDQDFLAFTPTSNIAGSFDTNSGVLTLSGTATLAEYQQALRTVTYQNTSDNPETLPRTLEFLINDGSSGNATASRIVEVQPVNDAPTGSDNIINFLEDFDYVLTPADFGFSDLLDNHVFAGVLIQKLPLLGTLVLNETEISNGQLIEIDEIANGSLRFIPEPDATGAPYDAFDFQVVDDGGTEFNGVDTSIETNEISFNVSNVNDAPSGTNRTVATEEDTTYTFARSDFGFTDVLDGDAFIAITINVLPDNGALTLNGAPVQPGTVVDVNSLDEGLLRYSPPPNANGLGYNGFSFQVHDDGGSANGGEFIDQTENFINFDLLGVNDPPLLITQIATLDEGTARTLATDLLSATDADDLLPEELLFTINSLPVNGILTLNGQAITAGTSFTLLQLQQNQLQYTHDESETSSDFFDIQVSDGGEDGAAAATGRFELLINEVIDPPPVIDNESLLLGFGQRFDSQAGSLLESGASTLAAESINTNDRLIVSLETPPSRGALQLNSDGSFIYQHDGTGALVDSFSYRVTNEDGIFSIASVSILVEPPIEAAFEITAMPELVIDQQEPEAEAVVEEAEELAPQAEPSSQITLTPIDFAPADFSTGASELINVEQVRTTQNFNFSLQQQRISDAILDGLTVRQHNTLQSAFIQNSQINNSSFAIELPNSIREARATDIVNNTRFIDGLSRVDRDLQESEEQSNIRYQLAHDTTIGISISVTAGLIAWGLRAGAMFASLMAATPLWSGIDPFRVMSGDDRDDKNAQDSSVEKIFNDE